MKKVSLLILLAAAIGFSAFQVTDLTSLKIGARAPYSDVKMQDVSGKMQSLQDVSKKNGLLVIFSSNTCPFVIATQERYRKISELCAKNDIGMIAINSNEAQREDVDSFGAMKKFAEEQAYDFPYVVDKNSLLANAFGATRTPDIFLFSGSLQLVYKGAIDDSHREPSMVKETFLANAIQNMLKAETISPTETKAVGCTIKRKEIK